MARGMPGLGLIAMATHESDGRFSLTTRIDTRLARWSWMACEPGWWLLGLAPRRQARIAAWLTVPLFALLALLDPDPIESALILGVIGGMLTRCTLEMIRQYDRLEERFPNYTMADVQEIGGLRSWRFVRIVLWIAITAPPPYTYPRGWLLVSIYALCAIWPLYAAAWIMPSKEQPDPATARARRRLTELARSIAPARSPLPA
jgi:hypothetical protein